mgnify:CR=1 FL=1
MLSWVRPWREHGWTPVTAPDYARAWQLFGGSVATHPLIVARLSALAEIPVRYLGRFAGDELLAAVACWDRHLALSKDVLKERGQRGLFDLGNAEVILPIAERARVPVRWRMHFVSEINRDQISTLRPQPEELAMLRPLSDCSTKFLYNQRRELRLLEQLGGRLRPILDYSPAEQATIYADLFRRRWGFSARGEPHLAQVFGLLREFMTGSVLLRDEQPIAIQILYRVQAPKWISLEYINGGVDPQHSEYSPGSVLTFVNVQAERAEALAAGKPLRYSFGRAGDGYKDRWCHRTPVYRT